ncbi:MAG: DUF2189 domain-containing protein [Rhodospirillales bacterium]|nr:DUF2189 domain-containing protein [Rhodospirillales bacterium]
MTQAVPVFRGPTPFVRKAALDRPWVWLARGWADLQAAPKVSLAYGGAFVAASYAIALFLVATESVYLLLPLAAGFLLLAPLLAVGLYEASRLIGIGRTPTLGDALSAFRANPEHMAYMGFVLMLVNLFWTRMAMLIFALFFGSPRGTLQDLIDMTLFSPASLPFLVVGTLVGFVLAAAVFAISAVSIPMLLDRPETPVWVAIATSFVAVRENFKPMALWAALICAFTGFGMVPFFLGLAVTMPLIGHATWHCYKDLVEISDPS